jgi:ribosomal protein S12 methylthiotransferase
MAQRFYVETLGCPKNQVDSDKLIGTLLADGMTATDDPSAADLVVVNTCAFIDEARKESIDTILALEDQRKEGGRLVVTGCMAERYGSELAEALPEVDQVAGFGVPVNLLATKPGKPGKKSIAVSAAPIPTLDLLNLPRPKSSSPWAYVKIAEGCDRSCGFCAIPSFRGPQRSRDISSILDEVEQLEAQEIVLVAQDLASYGKDRPDELGAGSIVPLVRAVSAKAAWTRLLYLYPSDLTDELIDAICDTGVPYFDLSLQHVSKPLLRRMRRWGDGQRFLQRIAGHPPARTLGGVPQQLHRRLSGRDRGRPRPAAVLRRAGAARLVRLLRLQPGGRHLRNGPRRRGRQSLMHERLAELREMQDDITARRARRPDRYRAQGAGGCRR